MVYSDVVWMIEFMGGWMIVDVMLGMRVMRWRCRERYGAWDGNGVVTVVVGEVMG